MAKKMTLEQARDWHRSEAERLREPVSEDELVSAMEKVRSHRPFQEEGLQVALTDFLTRRFGEGK